ncbi:MAG: DNA-directed RNA polymerase subunit omega [Defluviitaleaceae bacterium]|nr:DNA-directed RNA polymerase subunit omega [Defluviitaleaceae bacterium]MCL2238532.1 DNA-directed RNA polymerase subunit omega [Defluviitaleaceae bacterium]
MLRPSYSELMETINTNELMSSKITSRYTIVLAAAKRARQIIDGANPLTYAPTDRAVSIAVKEMIEGKLLLTVTDEILDGTYERMLKDQYKTRSISAVSKDDLREELKDSYEAGKFDLYEEDDNFHEPYADAELTEEKENFERYTDEAEASEGDDDEGELFTES